MKDLTPVTTTQVLTDELLDTVELIQKNRVNLRRRIGQIGKLQRTAPGGDGTQAAWAGECIEIQDSLTQALDRLVKSLLRPQGVTEPPIDTDRIMEELTKGRGK